MRTPLSSHSLFFFCLVFLVALSGCVRSIVYPNRDTVRADAGYADAARLDLSLPPLDLSLADLNIFDAAQIDAPIFDLGVHDILTKRDIIGPQFIDEFNNSTLGKPNGITYIAARSGQAAVFSRAQESRVQYELNTLIPTSGTLEWWVKIDSGYYYSDYTLNENQSHALLFTTDIQGGDVTWAGSAWFYVNSNGNVSLSFATGKYGSYGGFPPQEIKATTTSFRFGQWHAIGISYGNQGMYIKLDGTIVASNAANTQILGAGGNHSVVNDIPTIGESVSGFWANNQHEGGFNGAVDRFRISTKQKDWYLTNASVP